MIRRQTSVPWRGLTIGLVLALGCAVAPAAAQETFGYTTSNLPPNLNDSDHGSHFIDGLYYFILYLTGAVCLGVFACLLWFLVRYRHQPGRRAAFIHGNNKLEIFWTLIPTVILALIAAFSQNVWSDMKSVDAMPVGDDVVHVRVVGRQFAWYFQYPGPDGKFGENSVHWQQNTGNPAEEIGLRRGFADWFMSEAQLQVLRESQPEVLEPDPNAFDDVVVTELVLPVGKKVHFEITSKDVLHSFFLKDFRVKQDAVPGLVGHAWIHPAKTSLQVLGRAANGAPKAFDIICAELCGANHFTMRGPMIVVSQEEFEQWLEENASDPSEFEQ